MSKNDEKITKMLFMEGTKTLEDLKTFLFYALKSINKRLSELEGDE